MGEAIGSAVEFLPRDSYDELTGMQGIKPGEWTDGTAMALCLARSLLASDTVEQYDFMERLQAWLTSAENTAGGRTLAVGETTRTAIESFIEDDDPSAGSPLAEAAGNGSLIRQAPLAVFASRDRNTARFMSNKQSRATHATIECLDACDLFMDQLLDALNGADKAQTLRPRVIQLSPNLLAINGGEWRDKARDDLRSSAYVVDTLDAAIWAVGHSSSFREAGRRRCERCCRCGPVGRCHLWLQCYSRRLAGRCGGGGNPQGAGRRAFGGGEYKLSGLRLNPVSGKPTLRK